MYFKRLDPHPDLQNSIECYWIAEDDSPVSRRTKIIPDGFTEIIFHYGDPYRIRLNDVWEVQSAGLVAGQISKHFFLENSGVAGMMGIKFKPTALAHIFGVSMKGYTNAVSDIRSIGSNELESLSGIMTSGASHDVKKAAADDCFRQMNSATASRNSPVDRAVNMIFGTNGMSAVADVCKVAGTGERQLENLFSKFVGLSPKLFSRVIRFNYIFKLVNDGNRVWTDLAYQAAYYDQSHFIRNFRDFTGENPGDYMFDERNMANFFLKKAPE